MKSNPQDCFLSELMTSANMGWWEADVNSESYICSEYISNLLGLDKNGTISFSDFNSRILKEEQHHTTVHSFDSTQQRPEVVYLLDSVRGPIWIRSKVCFQKVDESGNVKIYGIAEVQDGPDMASAYQALQRNELLLHNIYKNLPVGIELYDINGILIDLNDKELDMFHLNKKEEILGINIFENPIFPEEMKKKLRRNEDADFTFRYDFSKVGSYYQTRKRKGTIDLVTKVTTLYDDNHQPINYLLINADKTEMTVAYNKIQEFESFFELIGDYAKVGYAHYNIKTQKGYAQKSWYKNIGEAENTPLVDIVGIYSHIHPEDLLSLTEFFKNVENGTETKLSKEVRILREDGNYTWTCINLLLKNYDPENDIIELISINYDITKLKQTEMILIKARDKAEESDRLKSAFLANMKHEIRTPLNAIVGFSNLLASTDNTEEKEQYNLLIQHNNDLLLNIVNDVLDISKIESGHIEFHPVWFNLSELIKETVAEYTPNVPPEIKFFATCPKPDYIVELDSMHVKQILNNIVSNALKYTSEGTVQISYELKEEGQVRISVADTGCGIPEDKIDKIFERFEKLDYYVQGAGLGLSISKSLVDKMGGRIEVDSIVGVGSTFRIILPCRVMLMDELLRDGIVS